MKPDLEQAVEIAAGLSEARPVLFLDIDGVVLSGEELWSNGPRHLPPHKIALVQEICDRTGAVICVSSTWRYSEETYGMLRHRGLPLHRDWRTPRGSLHKSGLILATTRGDEIASWLSDHPEVTTYAIVDDDSDMLPRQMPHFVKTPFETGLERDHVEQLVSLLAVRTILEKGNDRGE